MDNLFFYSSKIIWKLISPDSLFVIFFLGTLLLYHFGYRRYTRSLLLFISLALVSLSFFPLGSWMLHPLETRFAHNPVLPEKVDGIVVLGGSVKPGLSDAWQQLEVNSHAERLNGLIELARDYPDARLIFTGGSAKITQNQVTESAILARHLHRLGIDEGRVEFEGRARNTAENAYYTRRLANPGEHEKWILITTAFHMPRSIGVFCQQNWSLIPFPVDHHTYPDRHFDIGFNLLGNANQLQAAMHEWLGLASYYLTGKIPNLLPAAC
jgi:uncharacterized SAM-binding protein YcdF (DUF218 family)